MHVVFLWDRRQIWHWPQQHPKARCLGGKQHRAGGTRTPQEGLCFLSQQFPWGRFPFPGWFRSRVLHHCFLFLSLLHPTDQGGHLSSDSNQWKNPADSSRSGIFLWQCKRKDTIDSVKAGQETQHHMRMNHCQICCFYSLTGPCLYRWSVQSKN